MPRPSSSNRRFQFTLRSLLVWITVIGGTVWAVWYEPWRAPKLRHSTEIEAQTRLERIELELLSLAEHPWAGEYYYGDGLGANIRLALAPKHGFVFEWRGCTGYYDRNYGSVSFENDVVRLHPQLHNQRKGFQGIALEFIPVHWSSRHYLIAIDETDEFCDAVVQSREPRSGAHGRFLLRDGDCQKPALGSPTVPDRFENFRARLNPSSRAVESRR